MSKRANSGNREIGERIRRRRMSLGLKQVELADRLGHGDSNTVSRWERGVLGVSTESVSKLSVILGVTTDYLLNGAESAASNADMQSSNAPSAPSDLPPSNVRPVSHHTMVPLVSSDVKVCCGAGNIYPDSVEWEIVGSFPVETRTLINYNWQAGDGGFHVIDVEGDSMEEQIHDGDRVLFVDTQQHISNGDIYIVRYNGRLLIRHIVIKPRRITLVASNRAYKDIEVDGEAGDEFCVIGKVIEVYSMRKLRNLWG